MNSHAISQRASPRHRQHRASTRRIKERFIATWAEALSLPQAPATFHREVLVLEDGIEYWLPVQDVVADAMIRELEPGQAIEIFAVYAGQSLHDHVFLVNEFMTAGKPPAEGGRRDAASIVGAGGGDRPGN